MVQEKVWSLDNKGKDKISLRKGGPYKAEGLFDTEGTYSLEISTDEDRKGPVAVRSIKVHFVLVFNGETDDPVSVTKTVHCKRRNDVYKFTLPPSQSLTWRLEASTQAILKPIIFRANLLFSPGFEDLKEPEITEEKQEDYKLSRSQKQKLNEAMTSWPKRSKYNEMSYPQDKAIEEMSRDSIWKQRAFDLGLIRPFLLFVSMDPKTRLQWSLVLKIEIISKPYYGDAHQEAYKLLVRKQKGLQPRASHAFTETARPLKPNPVWYQILHRVCRKANSGQNEGKKEMKTARKPFEAAMTISMNANNEEMFQLEEMFSGIVRNVALAKLQEDDPQYYSSLIERMETDEVKAITEKLKKVGYSDDSLMKYIATTTLLRDEIAAGGVDKWADSKKEGTVKNKAMIVVPIVAIGAQLALGVTSPLTIIPAFMLVRNTAAYVFRETPGRLLSPLIALLKQKDVLAYHGVKIDDYYVTAEKINKNNQTNKRQKSLKLYYLFM